MSYKSTIGFPQTALYTRKGKDTQRIIPREDSVDSPPGQDMSVVLTQSEAASARPTYWAEFRLIPRVETWPGVVSFAQTAPGKVLLLAVFGSAMYFFVRDFSAALWYAFLYGFITFLPEYRRLVLVAVPLLYVVVSGVHKPLQMGTTLSVIGLGMVLYWCAMCWPKSAFGRRPLVFLLSGFSLLIVAAAFVSPDSLSSSVLWALVAAMAGYVWFIAYALSDRNSKPRNDAALELASFRPLWGSTNTPFPKGAAYLRRIEAKTPEQLAITQLKGIKLLVWAILLALLQSVWFRFFHSYLHIPLPEQAMALSVRGTPAPLHIRWISQILAYFELILGFSILGHRFIACARMAGFNALRNTYRPLSATSLIDFFNRFYYYFKELLVDFFYFPAFLRYFKKHRRLRTIFATFSAVVFGDTFYHVTRDWHFIRERGLWKGIASYQVEFVYVIALAIGLSISQLRQRGHRHQGFLRGRVLPICGVAVFYILVSFFETDTRTFTLAQTVRYFASMFFIHF